LQHAIHPWQQTATCGGVNVLNLVAGEAAVVESPDDAFAPFPINFAETFIVPAAVGRYTITPVRIGADRRCATIKAFVRPTFEGWRHPSTT